MTDGTIVGVLQNMFGGAATAIIGAMMGRLMWHTSEVKKQKRRFFGKELLWELPVAFGMGVFGEGAADYFMLSDTAGVALIVALAYLGPRGIEAACLKWFDKKS